MADKHLAEQLRDCADAEPGPLNPHWVNEALRLADALRDGTYLLSVERDATETELRRLAGVEAERDALRADAERYRWLRECARATGEHWGGRWSLVIEGPAPGNFAPPARIDAAIDAAREGGGNG